MPWDGGHFSTVGTNLLFRRNYTFYDSCDQMVGLLVKWVTFFESWCTNLIVCTLAQKISKYCSSPGHVLTCKCQNNLSIATLVNAFTLPDTYGEEHFKAILIIVHCYICYLRSHGRELGFNQPKIRQQQVLRLYEVVDISHMMTLYCTGWLLVPWMPATGPWNAPNLGHLRFWGSSLDLGLREPAL